MKAWIASLPENDKRGVSKSTLSELQERLHEVLSDGAKLGDNVFNASYVESFTTIWFDPQSGRRGITFDDYVEKMLAGCVKIRRIDNQLINPKFAQRLIKARKQL